MKTDYNLTAIIEREGDGYVSFCPDLDIASQGDSIEEARSNLIEALELFFETASKEEILQRKSF
jgi:predicted RNase H-like HicB family nuclease